MKHLARRYHSVLNAFTGSCAFVNRIVVFTTFLTFVDCWEPETEERRIDRSRWSNVIGGRAIELETVCTTTECMTVCRRASRGCRTREGVYWWWCEGLVMSLDRLQLWDMRRIHITREFRYNFVFKCATKKNKKVSNGRSPDPSRSTLS